MELICIVCPNSCKLHVDGDTVTGNKCPRGLRFAQEETTCPKRTVCSTVKTVFADYPVLPVRTSQEIPKSQIFELMKLINDIVLDRRVSRGEVIIANVLDSGADLISTSNMLYGIPSASKIKEK